MKAIGTSAIVPYYQHTSMIDIIILDAFNTIMVEKICADNKAQ
jgi:hypothetical protein